MCAGRLFRPSSTLSGLRVDIPAELRGDDDLIADGSQSLTHEFLIREWPVCFRRVEDRHAALGGGANDPDAFLPVCRRTVAVAQAHATVSDSGYFQRFPICAFAY